MKSKPTYMSSAGRFKATKCTAQPKTKNLTDRNNAGLMLRAQAMTGFASSIPFETAYSVRIASQKFIRWLITYHVIVYCLFIS